MIQYALPDRLLLDRIDDLVFADPAPARLGHEPPACRPLRSSVVHCLG
ncbi:hypothetical protein [Streptomyces sp. NPDC004675]